MWGLVRAFFEVWRQLFALILEMFLVRGPSNAPEDEEPDFLMEMLKDVQMGPDGKFRVVRRYDQSPWIQ